MSDLNEIGNDINELANRIKQKQHERELKRAIRNSGVVRSKIDGLLIKNKNILNSEEVKTLKDTIHGINERMRMGNENDLEDLKQFNIDMENFHKDWESQLKSRV